MVSTGGGLDVAAVRAVAGAVPDPEIPVLTLADLGVVRGVRVPAAGPVEVDLTPTYTGCPATEVIVADVRAALAAAGAADAVVRVVLSPAWTTDWISETGRSRLAAYGIAPPGQAPAPGAVAVTLTVRCPRCGSPDTRETSRFGSTPCKALWVCRSCAEPFEAVKPL